MATRTANAFRPFLDDHRRVLERLAALEPVIARQGRTGRLSRRGESSLRELVTALFHQFSTHMSAEENVLYPALAEAFPAARQSLRPLQREHAELRTMLLRLDALLGNPATDSRDEQVAVQARDLIDLLTIHIRKEEHSVLDVARRVLTPGEISALGRRIAVYRGASPGRRTRTNPKGTRT